MFYAIKIDGKEQYRSIHRKSNLQLFSTVEHHIKSIINSKVNFE